MISPLSISAIVTLSFSGRTLKELEAWYEALNPYGVTDEERLVDGGHVGLVEDLGVGSIMGPDRTPTVADVRSFIERARAAGADEDSELDEERELIAVDLPTALIEPFECGSHVGVYPRGVMVSAHPLCQSHT